MEQEPDWPRLLSMSHTANSTNALMRLVPEQAEQDRTFNDDILRQDNRL